MPNWVTNTLDIEGTPEDIKAIKAQLSAEYVIKETSWNPETKENEVKESTVSKDISFWNIVRPPADKIDEYHTIHGWGADGATGQTHFNWYNFNNREWGCKWDASEANLTEETETHLSYYFNTPWAPPLPAMEHLSLQYPNATLRLRYEEEQGWGGVESYQEGVSETEEVWDIPESHADNVAIDRMCICSWDDEPEDWYEDCPNRAEKIAELEKESIGQDWSPNHRGGVSPILLRPDLDH